MSGVGGDVGDAVAGGLVKAMVIVALGIATVAGVAAYEASDRRPRARKNPRKARVKRGKRGAKRGRPKRKSHAPFSIPWWGSGMPASGDSRARVGTRVFYSPRYDAAKLPGVSGGDTGAILKIDRSTPDPMLGQIPAVVRQRGSSIDVEFEPQTMSKGAVVQFDNGIKAHVPMWNLIVDDGRKRS